MTLLGELFCKVSNNLFHVMKAVYAELTLGLGFLYF